MFRMLNNTISYLWGWKSPNNPTLNIEKQKKKKLTGEWVIIGNHYVKISSHANVAKCLTTTPILLNIGEQQQKDALSDYQNELSNTISTLKNKLEKLEQFKAALLLNDAALNNDNHAVHADKEKMCENSMNSITQFFQNMFNAIKADLQPADNELNNLLEKSHKEMQVLFQQLKADSDALQDNAKSREEKRKICLDMFNLNIAIIRNLLNLITDVQAELQYCLDCESLGEKAMQYIVAIVVRMVLQVPLPSLEGDFSDIYRHILTNEIASEKSKLEIVAADAEARVDETINLAGKQFDVNEPTPLNPTPVKANLAKPCTATVFYQNKNKQPEEFSAPSVLSTNSFSKYL